MQPVRCCRRRRRQQRFSVTSVGGLCASTYFPLVTMNKHRMIAGVGQNPHNLRHVLHSDILAVLVRRHYDAVVLDARIFEEVEGGHVERC